MPENPVSNVLTNNAGAITSTVGSAAVGAAKLAFIQNPPQLLQRLYYWVRHNETTLTNPGAKAAFELFYKCVCKILESKTSAYPERLEICLAKYTNTLPQESVYNFTPLDAFDIKKIQEEFQASDLKVHGRRIKQDSLTGSVINLLVNLKCMRVGETLSVPKVIYSFLVSMSLEFADTQNSIEKKELVTLMNKVVGVVIGKDDLRTQFALGAFSQFFCQETFPPLQKLCELPVKPV